ncbi:auxin efflux carrier [Fragilaria crotonensis]|nr:auxin efflux carrier [Fragilaria crotonensis]
MSFVISGIMESLPGGRNSAALRAAGKAMAELGVAGCVGATCVHCEYLSADTVRALSQATFTVLLPLFLGTGIFKTVTTYGLQRSSMSVPLLAVFHSFLMFWISKHWLLPLFRIDSDATLMSCSFGNSGVLPFMFAESLFRHQPDMLAKCNANISLYLVGVTPFFWSLGFAVLVRSKKCGVDGASPRMRAGLKRLLPPPVIGVMTGLILAVSPLLSLFLSTSSEETAPLGVFYDSFQHLGRAANPLALLVLTCPRHGCCKGEHRHHHRICY